MLNFKSIQSNCKKIWNSGILHTIFFFFLKINYESLSIFLCLPSTISLTLCLLLCSCVCSYSLLIWSQRLDKIENLRKWVKSYKYLLNLKSIQSNCKKIWNSGILHTIFFFPWKSIMNLCLFFYVFPLLLV